MLPVLLGLIVVAIAFQIANGKFLSPQNLVNLFEQSSIYMLLAMAEIFALLLGEIDLSVGLVMALSAVITAELVQPAGSNLHWWESIVVALLIGAAIGAIQGTMFGRLKMPAVVMTRSGRRGRGAGAGQGRGGPPAGGDRPYRDPREVGRPVPPGPIQRHEDRGHE